MTGSWGTETDTMLATAQRIRDIQQAMQGQMRSLQSQLAPLAGTWRGQASIAFQQVTMRWNEDATRINTALDDIATKVSQGGRNYAASDEENRQAINRLGGAEGAGASGPTGSTPPGGGGLGQYL